jgi:hypothetical protein
MFAAAGQGGSVYFCFYHTLFFRQTQRGGEFFLFPAPPHGCPPFLFVFFCILLLHLYL